MKRYLALPAALLTLALAPSAQAEFGLSEFDVAFTDEKGKTVSQAGAHPFQMDTSLHFISTPTGEGGEVTEEAAKDILVDQIEGFAGNPGAVPRCRTVDFLTSAVEGPEGPACPNGSALGVVSVVLSSKVGASPRFGAVYNLEPPPGTVAKLGFWIAKVPVTIEAGVGSTPPYRITAGPTNLTQVLEVISSQLTLWGNPADPAHDPLRGHCIDPADGESLGECPANVSEDPFITLPRACKGPLETVWRADSWQNPGVWVEGSAETRDDVGNPLGMTGCGKLDFGPEVSALPTTSEAESSTGLEIEIDVTDEGLLNPDGLAQADIAATRFAFPTGMTLNPSAAEGLGVCTLAEFEAAKLHSGGCPQASKLGSLEVETPILEDHTLKGSFYLAAQRDNPFGSLLASYLFIRDEELGVFMKLPTEVRTDPKTGRVEAIAEDLPPFPLEHVRVGLRSGPRAPFVTPPTCGSYATEVELTPSAGKPLITTSAFKVTAGPGGGPCPAGQAPFDPGFEAGTQSNAAGSYSPFAMRLTRNDGDQDLTKFSATLPPGLVGKLAGVAKCSDGAIAGAKTKSGRAEQASPSCPSSSHVGSVLAGAGVGTALTWAGGNLWLAGPYNGAPLSVVAIVPAVAGPFDVGTVVTRVALDLDPITAEVEVDGSRSDPIPHILEGIPLKVREIRVFADRPQFTLNPTSCEESSTRAQVFGSGGDVFSSADDVPLLRSARFQASSCASLGFKPKLDFKLKGGTKRGGRPALTATYVPRAGDANLESLVVRLPRSAFLDQAHIRTICTRVQFAADACPPGAKYGFIEARTPLLEEPLKGPVWLRSSNHNLPDLVFDLRGLVDVEVATRIDSIRGGIRARVEGAPDAPITKVVLRMQGAEKGLIVNSRNLCGKASKAGVQFAGHNGKVASARPVMRAVGCGKLRQGKRRRR